MGVFLRIQAPSPGPQEAEMANISIWHWLIVFFLFV
jgi:hypothetical protein